MHEILGQDHAVGILRSALRAGRMHHAWILSGPVGVGKFTTEKAFAKILLDPDAAPGLSGDVECDPAGRTARLIDAGTHPDFFVIRKELALYSDNPLLRSRKLANIPLDVLREHMIGGKTSDEKYREAPAYRTAGMGHGKVFIVDEAELIDRLGQNALLKTLEEPPPATYLFLVTAHAERLLPTIVSRCQHVRFGPLDPASLRRWFDRAGLSVRGEERAWIESFCDGAPGVAARAAEYGFYRWQRALEPSLDDLDRGLFPAGMGEALAALVEEYATAWVKANANASKDAANKDGARHVLALLSAEARRRLHAACAAGRPAESPLAVIDLVREAERQLAANVNMKQLLENLVVQWAARARGEEEATASSGAMR